MKAKDSAADQVDLIGFTEQEQLEKLKKPETGTTTPGQRRYHPKLDRHQTDFIGYSLDDYVDPNCMIRAIDVFVEHLNLASIGFKHSSGGESAGQPAYDPGSLLRLYLYGYANKVRSGRRLARECRVNVEVMWLMQKQTPQYRTIHKFRAENSAALNQANADFIMVCRQMELIGGKRVSIDGSHFRGNVSAKSFNTKETLEKSLEKAREQARQWQDSLEEQERKDQQADERVDEQAVDIEELKKLLEQSQQKQAVVIKRLEQLQASGESKLSYSDPDAKLLNKRGNKTQGYNVQIASDHRHYLIVGNSVTKDINDQRQLVPIAKAVKESLGLTKLEAVADKGYYSAMAITGCIELGITPYVAIPAARKQKEDDHRYTREQFRYDPEQNVYWCPAGSALKASGKPQAKPGQGLAQRFRSKGACARCEHKSDCLTDKGSYRDITRLLDQPALDEHGERMKAQPQIYRQRQGAVEHPFGTLKARAGWSHFLVRGLDKVQGEMSLMVLCYNFVRVLNILGYERFLQLCREMAGHKENASLTRQMRTVTSIVRLCDVRKIVMEIRCIKIFERFGLQHPRYAPS